MAKNGTKEKAVVREYYLRKIMEYVESLGEDVGLSKSNQFNFPAVTADGSEIYLTVTVTVPSGSRDGDPYDGYAMRQEYAIACQKKEEARKKKEKDNK